MQPNPVVQWAEQIKAVFCSGRNSALNLAKVLSTAKRKLHHGQWTALCRSGGLPFSNRNGEILVLIWKGLGVLDAHTCSYLPSSWRTLYLLAQLDSTLLVGLIGQQKIHPRLAIQQARALVARVKDCHRLRRSEVQRRLASFKDFVYSTFAGWTAGERDQVRAELLQLAHELATSAPVVLHKPFPSAFAFNDRHHPSIGSHSV